jgi:hypothetical protein
MKKFKVEAEYDKHLLDNITESKRARRKEEGFELVKDPPTWVIEENQWGKTFQYKRQIEGWEKLCIEAYFSGWVDFFDTVIYAGKIDHTIYFGWSEDIKGHSSLKIYFEPGSGPKPIPVPPQPDLLLAVPKPPPPPMS